MLTGVRIWIAGAGTFSRLARRLTQAGAVVLIAPIAEEGTGSEPGVGSTLPLAERSEETSAADGSSSALLRHAYELRTAVEQWSAGHIDLVLLPTTGAVLAWMAWWAQRPTRSASVAWRRTPIVSVPSERGQELQTELESSGIAVVTSASARSEDLALAVLDRLGSAGAGIKTGFGTLHVRATAATLDHQVLPLSPNGLAVLRCLTERPGGVVSRERLLAELPGGSQDPHTAEVAVARLREALSRAVGQHQLIRTVIKRGYQLDPGLRIDSL